MTVQFAFSALRIVDHFKTNKKLLVKPKPFGKSAYPGRTFVCSVRRSRLQSANFSALSAQSAGSAEHRERRRLRL